MELKPLTKNVTIDDGPQVGDPKDLKTAIARIRQLETLVSSLTRQTSAGQQEVVAMRRQLRDLESGDTMRALAAENEKLVSTHAELTEAALTGTAEAANEKRLREGYERENARFLTLLQRIQVAGEDGGATVGQLVAIARERLQ